MNIKIPKIQFDSRIIVNDCILKLTKGYITVVSGESGSGKTTLFKYIENQYLNVASCYQEPYFIEDLTIKDHIEMYKEVYQSSYQEYVSQLNIDNLLNKYPSQLSGGEKKRVGFYLNILKDEEILMFDEPTSSLNKEYSKIYISIIKELSKTHYILIFTHDKALMEEADYLYEIKNKECKIKKHISIDEADELNNKKEINTKSIPSYLIKRYKHFKLYKKISMHIIVICIVLVNIFFSLNQFMINRLELNSNKSNSTELLVYNPSEVGIKNNDAEYITFMGKPIDSKMINKIKKIKHIKGYESRYDFSEPLYGLEDITIGNFDSSYWKSFDLVGIKNNTNLFKFQTNDDDGNVIISTYNSKKIKANKIEKKFSDKGIYLSKKLYERIVENNKLGVDDFNQVTIQIELPIPLYNTYGKVMGSRDNNADRYVTSLTVKRETINVPLAGILKGEDIGVKLPDSSYAIYIDRDIVNDYINKNKPQSNRTVYVIDSDWKTYYINELPSQYKESECNRIFKDTIYNPTALTIEVDSFMYINDVKKELKKIGLYTTYEDVNNSYLQNVLLSMKNIFYYSSIILTLIILVFQCISQYLERNKKRELYDFLKNTNIDHKDISKILRDYYKKDYINRLKYEILVLILMIIILFISFQSLDFLSIYMPLGLIVLSFICFILIPLIFDRIILEKINDKD